MPSWLLPENIADVLPSEARQIEDVRRRILDNFRLYGYELVIPPMLEYVESLLTGMGQDMDLQLFKLVDQLSGRMLGVRADMTTQVARIDAHLLNRHSVTRLCYAGSVLHTQPSGLYATREPFQIGAEIYGHAGLEADAEIQELALSSLTLAGVSQIHLNLCHVGVFRTVLERDDEAQKNEAELFALLEAKDRSGLQELCLVFKPETRDALLALLDLYGDISVIERARTVLPKWPGITNALNELSALARLSTRVQVMIDLADLRGYHYHSGVMFAAYVPGAPNAVARGGRYDHVGEAFGRARPATGFSMDLREIAQWIPTEERTFAIDAPWSRDPVLLAMIASLRQSGEIVIQHLPGHENDQDEFDCDRRIVFEGGCWIVKCLS